jgi:RNA-directed DNA polymerase
MTPMQNHARPCGLLEPVAWKAGTAGSEGAGAQQCAPATRRFRIIWKRKRGTGKRYVCTFIAGTPVRELKRKIRALTRRLSQQEFRATLIRINQILRGWANYFRHAVAKHTFARLAAITWHRVARWVRHKNRMSAKALRQRFHDQHGWKPLALDGVTLFNIATVPVTRYRWRGYNIPTPWTEHQTTA